MSDLRFVFDISDVVGFASAHRIPSGIQRVQIGLVEAALTDEASAAGVMLAIFESDKGHWRRVPVEAFRRVAALATIGGDGNDGEWIAAVAEITRAPVAEPPMVMPRKSFLINLGTAWSLPNYLLAVRRQRSDVGLRYVQFIHDLVPVYAGDTCVAGLTAAFIDWLLPAFASTDLFLVSSAATERDLRRVAATCGLGAPSCARVPLDAVTRPNQRATAPLRPEPFVLFVGTIEPRKNHLLAFSAWAELIRRRGPERIPTLVCVGRAGWLCDDILAQLDRPDLCGKVVHLSDVGDDALGAWYDQTLFTLYPSRYEGWGLPITEALSRGKIPLVPRAEPFTEAAGSFGMFFEPGSAANLALKAETLIENKRLRGAMEDAIRQGFRARGWPDVWAGLARALAQCPAISSPPPVPPFGQALPLGRTDHTALRPGIASGEALRAGRGWRVPEPWGCATIGTATLCFSVPAGTRHDLRLYVGLRGLSDDVLTVAIEARPGEPTVTQVQPRRTSWCAVRLAAPATRSVVTIDLAASPPRPFGVETIVLADEADPPSHMKVLEFLAWTTCTPG